MARIRGVLPRWSRSLMKSRAELRWRRRISESSLSWHLYISKWILNVEALNKFEIEPLYKVASISDSGLDSISASSIRSFGKTNGDTSPAEFCRSFGLMIMPLSSGISSSSALSMSVFLDKQRNLGQNDKSELNKLDNFEVFIGCSSIDESQLHSVVYVFIIIIYGMLYL